MEWWRCYHELKTSLARKGNLEGREDRALRGLAEFAQHDRFHSNTRHNVGHQADFLTAHSHS
jgi:hypothetical protein